MEDKSRVYIRVIPKFKEIMRDLKKLYHLEETEMSEKIISEWITINWTDIEAKSKIVLERLRQ